MQTIAKLITVRGRRREVGCGGGRGIGWEWGYEGVGAGGLESGLIEANHRQQFVDN